jgi:hypothetical protein
MDFQIVSRDRHGRTASKNVKLGVFPTLETVALSWREKGKRRSILMSAMQVREIALLLQEQIDKSRKDTKLVQTSWRTASAGLRPTWRKTRN